MYHNLVSCLIIISLESYVKYTGKQNLVCRYEQRRILIILPSCLHVTMSLAQNIRWYRCCPLDISIVHLYTLKQCPLTIFCCSYLPSVIVLCFCSWLAVFIGLAPLCFTNFKAIYTEQKNFIFRV